MGRAELYSGGGGESGGGVKEWWDKHKGTIGLVAIGIITAAIIF